MMPDKRCSFCLNLNVLTVWFILCCTFFFVSWGECLAIIEDYNEFASATTHHLSPIVEAAFHHRDGETGWRLLRQMGETGLCPTKAVLTKLFNMVCSEREIGLQLLHLMQRYHWIPVEDTASAVYTFFERWFCGSCICVSVTVKSLI